MGLPEFAVIDVLDAIPDFGFAATEMPSRAKMAIVEPEHLWRQPGGNVDTVGNVPNGDGIFRFPLKQIGPHRA